MTYTTFNDDDTFRPELRDLWERTLSCAPTPGYLDREWTPSVICLSPDTEDIVSERSSPVHQPPSDQLRFHPAVERDDGSAWDKQPPDCIHYQIERRVKLNSRVVVKDTE